MRLRKIRDYIPKIELKNKEGYIFFGVLGLSLLLNFQLSSSLDTTVKDMGTLSEKNARIVIENQILEQSLEQYQKKGKLENIYLLEQKEGVWI